MSPSPHLDAHNPYAPPEEISTGAPWQPAVDLRDRLSHQELSLGQVLGLGWRVFSRSLPTLGLVALVVYLPLNLVLSRFELTLEGPDGRSAYLSYLRVVQLLEFFFGIVATLATIALTERRLKGERARLRDVMGAAVRRWGHALGTNIQAALVLLGLTLLLIVPGVIWGVYYAFRDQCVGLGLSSGSAALAQSKSLVQGRWGRIFGLLALLVAMQLGAGLAVGVLEGAVEVLIGEMHPLLWAVVACVQDLICLYPVAVTTVLFLNLHLMASQEQAPDPSPPHLVADTPAQA